jgi:hypothetical protein
MWISKYEELTTRIDELQAENVEHQQLTEKKITDFMSDAVVIDNNRKKWKQRALSLVGQLARYDDARLPEGSETWGSEE